MLLYNYTTNGSLQHILFGTDTVGIRLGWGSRVGVALESARALAYLHNDANPRIIHIDVKPNNIFLDENLTAHIRLPLDKMFPAELNEGNSHVTTILAGTMGYIDPDYLRKGQVSAKSDVYCFGIVLL